MTTLVEKRELMDATVIERTLDRMALQVLEQGSGTDLALVGIHRGGVPLADRLQTRLNHHLRAEIPVGMVDITLYRDDALMGLPHPIIGPTELDFDITGRRLVLVDDVLFTGRTVRAALDALTDFGRPRCIQLAVLLDRGHRELPIAPNVVGMTVDTDRTEQVVVALTELGDAADRVTLHTVTPDTVTLNTAGGAS